MSNANPTLSWPPAPRPAVLPLSRPPRQLFSWLDPGLKIMVPVLLLVFVIMAIKFGSLKAYVQLLSRQTYTSFLPALGAAYTLVMLIFQLGRTVLWACYKPYPPAEGPWPALTVIIPAYNEGAMVEKAIAAVATADYPADRLEIICIDDGSQDDTWFYIQRAQRHYPHLLRPIRFDANSSIRANSLSVNPGGCF